MRDEEGDLQGSIRQFDLMVPVTSSSSPAKTIFVIASAKPLACAIVAFGGIASRFGSVTTSCARGTIHCNSLARRQTARVYAPPPRRTRLCRLPVTSDD